MERLNNQKIEKSEVIHFTLRTIKGLKQDQIIMLLVTLRLALNTRQSFLFSYFSLCSPSFKRNHFI